MDDALSISRRIRSDFGSGATKASRLRHPVSGRWAGADISSIVVVLASSSESASFRREFDDEDDQESVESFPGALQHLTHLLVQQAVAGDHLIFVDGVVPVLKVGHSAASFCHDEHSRSRIPRFQPGLPETVEAPHGHVAKIEGG